MVPFLFTVLLVSHYLQVMDSTYFITMDFPASDLTPIMLWPFD